jgi:hypothetical protein
MRHLDVIWSTYWDLYDFDGFARLIVGPTPAES